MLSAALKSGLRNMRQRRRRLPVHDHTLRAFELPGAIANAGTLTQPAAALFPKLGRDHRIPAVVG